MSPLTRYLDPGILSQLSATLFDPKQAVVGNLAGLHQSMQSGFAVEFQGHREYAPGDDPKHIDWRVYFRHEKYFVKQFELETNLVCHLLLDVSASMRYGDGSNQKLNYAARMASTLAFCITRQNDQVSFATVDNRVRVFLPPSSSFQQILKMTSHLDQIEPQEDTDLAGCIQDLAGRTGRREIVVIFSDFFTDLAQLEAAIQRLRFSRHEVILFHVLHHDELTLPIQGMTEFVGLETGDKLLVDSGALRKRYMEVLDRYNSNLDAIAHRNDSERFLVDTSRGIDEVLLDYLNQRREMIRSGGQPRSRLQWLPTGKLPG